MAMVFTFYAGVLAGLVLCSEAVWNTTEGPSANETGCHHLSNPDNCTDKDADQWHGHFSTCPEEFTYYCIHGECRYIQHMEEVSCRCEPGFVGSRCELLDLDWLKDERRQIIIICVCAGLALLIICVAFVCFCSLRRGPLCKQKPSRRDQPQNGTEKPYADITLSLIADATDQPRGANSV